MLHDGTATSEAASSNSTHPPAPKPLQFSLRTLLAALAVFPLLLAVAAWYPELSLGSVICIALGLVAFGCLKFADRLKRGGRSRHQVAAGAMVYAAATLTLLLITAVICTFCTILFEALIPPR